MKPNIKDYKMTKSFIIIILLYLSFFIISVKGILNILSGGEILTKSVTFEIELFDILLILIMILIVSLISIAYETLEFFSIPFPFITPNKIEELEGLLNIDHKEEYLYKDKIHNLSDDEIDRKEHLFIKILEESVIEFSNKLVENKSDIKYDYGFDLVDGDGTWIELTFSNLASDCNTFLFVYRFNIIAEQDKLIIEVCNVFSQFNVKPPSVEIDNLSKLSKNCVDIVLNDLFSQVNPKVMEVIKAAN